MQFESFVRTWLNTYAITHKAASSVTKDIATIRIHLDPYFADKKLASITTFDVIRLQADLSTRVKPKTVNNIIGLLGKMMADARRWKMIAESPCDGVKPIKYQSTGYRFWSFDELERFRNFCRSRHPRLCEVVDLAVYTGMRRGEIAGLKRDAIDLDAGVITVKRNFCCVKRTVNEYTKSKKIRHIPMLEAIEHHLRQHKLRAPDELLYGPSIESLILKNFRKMCLKAGVTPIRFHDLRHTFASHLAMSGANMFDISKLLGHSTIGMSERYAHLAPNHLQSVINMLSKKGVHHFFTPREDRIVTS